MSTFGIPDPGRASSAIEMVVAGASQGAYQMFTFEESTHIRVLRGADGEPLFVGPDVARALGYRDAHNLIRRIDAEDQGYSEVSTPGGVQRVLVINESGLYAAVFASQLEDAQKFRRWVTKDVLPTIRRTGSYSQRPAQPTALPSKKELAQWVVEAEERAELAESKVRELAGPASSWNELAEAAGDYSVADAAKVLSRDPHIATGERRLFASMQAFGWTFRRDGRWRAYQRHVEMGWLTEKVGKPYVRNGEMCVGDPTVRVTPKGLAQLHHCLGGSGQLALMAVSE